MIVYSCRVDIVRICASIVIKRVESPAGYNTRLMNEAMIGRRQAYRLNVVGKIEFDIELGLKES